MPPFIARRALVALVAIAGAAGCGDPASQAPESTTSGSAIAGSYHESPLLAERVASNTLPPVEKRLPKNPMLIQPIQRIGKYGGTWRLAMRTDYDVPFFTRYLGYEHLVRWNEQWTRTVPNVAQAVEVNEDATEYTFFLREGMRWSDGHPFTADDILFWYEDVLLNPELVKAPPIWLTTKGKLVQVRKKGEFVVSFRFAAPNALFLSSLALPQGIDPTSFPRHFLKQFHPRYNPDGLAELVAQAKAANWVDLFHARAGLPSLWADGRHPTLGLPTLNAWIVVAGTEPSAKELIFERNPYYWKIDPNGNQLPYIDYQVYRRFDNGEDLKRFAYAGGVDMQHRHVTLEAHQRSQVNYPYNFFAMVSDQINVLAIGINLSHIDPQQRATFQNKDFRIGLSHAINRRRIIDTVLKDATKPYQLAPAPESPYYDDRLAHQYTEYSVRLANEFLDKAGLVRRRAHGFRLRADGQPLVVKILVTSHEARDQKIVALVCEDWRKVGIDARMDLRPRHEYYQIRAENRHDAAAWNGGGASLDLELSPFHYLPFSVDSMYAVAWAYWYMDRKNPLAQEPPAATKQQMALYDEFLGTPDPKERTALMRRILEIAADQFYVIGIGTRAPAQFPVLLGLVKRNFVNVPATMPTSWLYPNPAPTNTAQYFIDGHE